MIRSFRSSLLAALAGLLAACSANDGTTSALPVDPGAARASAPGAIAVSSNGASGNAVLVFPRRADGTLEPAVPFATGGRGTGAGLGNQGGVSLSGARRYLYAINAGSNDVSVFTIAGASLSLVGRFPSRGQQPISVTEHEGVVYVLNAGREGGIAGFRQQGDGSLVPIAGAIRRLDGTTAGPAQISFSPDGSQLVVTEKNTNLITLYAVDASGVAGPPRQQPSAGTTPFGFAFAPKGTLVVSEAFGGAPDASAVSSYRIAGNGALQLRSASVGTTETAACWVAITPDGRYAYITNTGSGSVTGYRLTGDGRLSILNPSGVTGSTGAVPIDLAITPDGRRLYTLASGDHQIAGFVVRTDGSLEATSVAGGLPTTASGMAAW